MNYSVFKQLPDGYIMATGVSLDSHDGISWMDTNDIIRWVAKKGMADDWAIYVGRNTWSAEEVANFGNKITHMPDIKKLFACDDELLSHYRK